MSATRKKCNTQNDETWKEYKMKKVTENYNIKKVQHGKNTTWPKRNKIGV